MPKQTILAVLALALFGGAGFLIYSTNQSPPPAPSSEQVAAEAERTAYQGIETAGPTATGAPQLDEKAIKEPVTQFILAVAHPNKQVTSEADKQAALQVLTPTLQTRVKGELGNDPSRLLDVPRAQSFTVEAPQTVSRGATVSVKFKYGSSEQTRIFTLEQAGGKWLISNIQAPAARRQ